jgi:Tfp pilus assembly protein PilO
MPKTRLWLLLTVPAVLLVFVAGWFLVVSPKRADADAVRTQTADIERNITSLRVTLAELKRKQADLPAQQAALAVLEKKIPADPQLPPLQRSLVASAQSAGVTLVKTAPGSPALFQAPGAPTAKPTTSAAAPAPTAGAVFTVPLNVVVTGEYTGLQQFVSAVEQMQRALLVQGFNLESVKTPDPVAPGSIRLTITGQVFVSAAEAATLSTPSASAGGPVNTGSASSVPAK